jgi:hypothetical protein
MHEFDLSGSRADRLDQADRARKALIEDGGVILRAALPTRAVLGLRRELTEAFAALSTEDWTWSRLRRDAGDDDLLAMRRALFACPSNGALFRHPRLAGFLGAVLEVETPFLHPRRWLRLNKPGTGLDKWTVPYHQDYRFVHGTQDVLTVWTPLHRCDTGGLRLELRSHRDGLRGLGERTETNHLPPATGVNGRNLAEPVCDVGDVVVFHSLTVHATAPNFGTLNRISVDARFQRPDDPMAREQLLPAMAPQDQLPIGAPGVLDEDPAAWSGDPAIARPAGLPLVPAGEFDLTTPAGTSRFAPVP